MHKSELDIERQWKRVIADAEREGARTEDNDVQQHTGKVERTFSCLSIHTHSYPILLDHWDLQTLHTWWFIPFLLHIQAYSLSYALYACANFRQSIKLRVVHHLLHLCKHQFGATHSLTPRSTLCLLCFLFISTFHLNKSVLVCVFFPSSVCLFVQWGKLMLVKDWRLAGWLVYLSVIFGVYPSTNK